MPSRETHPLTSNAVVVNREGDLELYAVHDTPKQVAWSSRGDLIIGAGRSYRVLSGYQEDDDPPEAWNAHSSGHYQRPLGSASRSRSRQARGSSPRDHSHGNAARSDRDKDNSLPLSRGSPFTNSSPSDNTGGKTFSPASLRNYTYNDQSGSSGDFVPPIEPRPKVTTERSKRRGRSRASPQKNSDLEVKRQTLKIMSDIVEDDISMTMRRRAIRGYGLTNVGKLHSLEINSSTDFSISQG